MAKKPQIKNIPEDLIESSSKTKEIRSLVDLANYFQRAGAHGPFTVDIPLFCAVHIPDKGFRKSNIPIGQRIAPDMVHIGKRNGLIFRFKIAGEFKRNGDTIDFIEVSWEDIVNCVPEFHARMNIYYGKDANSPILEIDRTVRGAIEKNAAMHTILSQGFTKAQTYAREEADDIQLDDNPVWGTF